MQDDILKKQRFNEGHGFKYKVIHDQEPGTKYFWTSADVATAQNIVFAVIFRKSLEIRHSTVI